MTSSRSSRRARRLVQESTLPAFYFTFKSFTPVLSLSEPGQEFLNSEKDYLDHCSLSQKTQMHLIEKKDVLMDLQRYSSTFSCFLRLLTMASLNNFRKH